MTHTAVVCHVNRHICVLGVGWGVGSARHKTEMYLARAT